jgi:hypothetical protein
VKCTNRISGETKYSRDDFFCGCELHTCASCGEQFCPECDLNLTCYCQHYCNECQCYSDDYVPAWMIEWED